MLLPTVLVLSAVFNRALSQDSLVFQVERYSKARPAHFRDFASELWTAPVLANQAVTIPFCTRSPSTVRITNIMYSNDGLSDTVAVLIDGNVLGSFQTHSRTNEGKLWQEMTPSGPIGGDVQLSSGSHQLKLEVTQADTYGVELDAVFLDVTGSVKGDMLHCETYCDRRINYKLSNKTKKVVGHISQQVREPLCPTDRNINIPVYQNDPSAGYTITASPPKYSSVSESQLQTFSRCQGDHLIWKFSHVTAAPYSSPQTVSGATLTFSGLPDNKAVLLDVSFTPGDAQVPDGYQIVGGNLKIVLANPQIPAFFKLEVFRDNEYVPQSVFRSMSADSLQWSLPDFRMLKNSQSALRIYIITDQNEELYLKEIVLEKIPRKDAVSSQLFSSELVDITTESIDQWWLTPQAMSVSADNNNVKGQNRIRVFTSIPFHSTKFEIMNLYSDGELNINALPPQGMDVVAFGTSVIIGKFDPTSSRPNAPIVAVDVDPTTLTFSLLYADGSTTTLHLQIIHEDTVVSVTNVTFPADKQSFPIAAVQSSWIHDGHNHMDHVGVDDLEPRAVIASRWQSFYGEYFSFFRRCVTTTDPQSSDLTIKLFGRTQ